MNIRECDLASTPRSPIAVYLPWRASRSALRRVNAAVRSSACLPRPGNDPPALAARAIVAEGFIIPPFNAIHASATRARGFV